MWKLGEFLLFSVDIHVQIKRELSIFTQPLRSGRIWHKVNF